MEPRNNGGQAKVIISGRCKAAWRHWVPRRKF